MAFTRLAPQASKALTGQPWSEATLKAGLQALAADVESLAPSAGPALALSMQMLVGQPCSCACGWTGICSCKPGVLGCW